MRVNIYGEELTGRVEPVAKIANGTLFKGLRLFLYFKGERWMHGPDDEDSTALTFWFADEVDYQVWKDQLRTMLRDAVKLIDDEDAFRDAVAEAKRKST